MNLLPGKGTLKQTQQKREDLPAVPADPTMAGRFRFSALDLNLLRIFDAVMAERSVVAAGRRVLLSPSAISHGLARLRSAVGDELFVRDGASMRPTSFAVEFAPTVRDTLLKLRLALETRGFDPRVSQRHFVVAATDYASALLMPGVIERLVQQDASVCVDVVSLHGMDIAQELDAGRIDLAVGTFVEVASRFRTRLLEEIEQVFVTRRHHPAQTLGIEELAMYPHVVVRLVDTPRSPKPTGASSDRGIRRNVHIGDSTELEGILAKHGLRRTIAALVPHPLAIGPIVAQSNIIGMLPRRLAESAAAAFDLRIHDDPCRKVLWPYSLVWHEQAEADLGVAWLRTKFEEVVAHGASNNHPQTE